jgi:hypothetical protein
MQFFELAAGICPAGDFGGHRAAAVAGEFWQRVDGGVGGDELCHEPPPGDGAYAFGAREAEFLKRVIGAGECPCGVCHGKQ